MVTVDPVDQAQCAQHGVLADDRPGSAGAARDLGLKIARDGRWFYQGSQIERPALVKLFATVLQRAADGRYWLVTPAERGQITVEDVPFTGVELAAEGSGRTQRLRLRTNLDAWVVVGADHPLTMRPMPGETTPPVPYVMVRDGLEARLERNVYYELAALAVPDEDGGDGLGVWSEGCFFALGEA